MATESDNVNSGALVTLLFVGAFAVLGIGLVVTALVRSETTEEAEKKEVGADRPYLDLVAEQTAKMAAPAAYADRNRGLVSLPIDRAMEVTVAGLVKDPNSATPPAPIGGSGGAGATDTGGSPAALGGTSSGGMPADPAAPTDSAAVEVAKPVEGSKDQEPIKPIEKENPDGKGAQPDKKPAPKKVAPQPVPAAPAPAAPAPAAPAPAPAAPTP